MDEFRKKARPNRSGAAAAQPADDECGFTRALAVIKGKWKSTIVWELHEQPIRFGALRRRLGRISEKMLSEQLRQLEDDGVVHREDFDESPPRVEYSRTPAGHALNDAAHRLSEWGQRFGRQQAASGEPANGGAARSRAAD